MEKPKKRWAEPSSGGEPSFGSEPASQPGGREVISRKELARQLRKQAYQRAKAARAVDPKHLALKEAAKQQRRELYRRVKEQRKARDAERDAASQASRAKERTDAKRQLAERVKSAIGPAAEPGRALARDIERALQCADIKELIEQLRAQSPALADQSRGDHGLPDHGLPDHGLPDHGRRCHSLPDHGDHSRVGENRDDDSSS